MNKSKGNKRGGRRAKAKGTRPPKEVPWTWWVEVDISGDDLLQHNEHTLCFVNSRYQVLLSPLGEDGSQDGWVWLSIKRRDKAAIHDWRELQRIKNTLLSENREAIELYPAESRVVDTSNQYHLWVLPNGEKFPLGWTDRVVVSGDDVDRPNQSRQRPLPEWMKPTHTPEEAEAIIAQGPTEPNSGGES